jgi:lipopolysaccharide export system permease protein
MKLSKIQDFRVGIAGVSVMDRYILTELIVPFLFGMGLFTSLGLSIGTLFDLVRKITESGLPIDIALKVMILQMPQFIVLAFPMSILLATLMAYGRLSSDSETIALQSIGKSIYRIVIPGVILSLLVAGLTFFFKDFVVPAATFEATNTLEEALDRAGPSLADDNIVYPEYQEIEDSEGDEKKVLARLFYAENFDGKKMNGLVILDRSRDDLNQILTAESASWNIADNRWDFFNGTIYAIAPDGSYRNIVRFQHQQLDLPREPLDLVKKCKDYDEMNIFQANQCLEHLELGSDEKKIRKLKVRIQEKISFPFICVVFGLMGAALGIRPQNTGKATSFGICVLIVFAYYLLSFISSNLGISGVLSPLSSAWLPNLFGFVIGGFILWRSAK